MLIQFNFRNFKSFKSETSFDMTAASIKEHQYNLVDIGTRDKYLKVAAIYGANASGKSNILDAFKFMSYFVMMSFKDTGINNETKERNIPVKSFKFDSESKEQSSLFEVFFVLEDTEYQYGFTLDRNKIYEEWLNTKKITDTKFKPLFNRELKNIICEKGFKSAEKFIDSVDDSVLFISLLAKTNIEKAVKINYWFAKTEVINFGNTVEEFICSHNNSTAKNMKDDLYRSTLESYLRAIDTGIVGVRVEEFSIDNEPKYIVFTKHKMNDSDNFEEIRLREESSGTQKMFVLFDYFYSAMDSGNVLFIDELDAKLHPLLHRYIVTMFHSRELNKKNAQLIYSTHDVSNLTKDLFRRDQIWFAEKDEYGSSSLYSLAEYREDNAKIRNDATYNKDYISGRYGAIPLLKEFNLMGEEK